MNHLKLKLRKLFFRLKHGFFSIENIVLIIAIILCLIWTYQSILAMSRNWVLTERLNSNQHTLELLKIEIETLTLENEYYKTTEYQELAARKLLNKKLNGEQLVLLPENSSVAQTKHTLPTPKTQPTISNFQKWWLFLFPDYH